MARMGMMADAPILQLTATSTADRLSPDASLRALR